MAHKTDEVYNKHPASIIVSSRIDHRTLASLAMFWRKSEEPVRSVSEIIRVSVETFHEMLLLSGRAQEVESSSEALNIITSLNLAIPSRSRKTLARALSNESSMLEGFDVANVVSRKVSALHPQVAKAEQLLKETLEASTEESIQEALDRRDGEQREKKLEMDRLTKGGSDDT